MKSFDQHVTLVLGRGRRWNLHQELIGWANTTTKWLFGSQKLRGIEMQSNNK
jgi:hypothetical protein